MLSEKQIREIRETIEKSDNPLYFFDDDIDGLCSYILFQQKYKKGRGIAIKSTPTLDVGYLRKVEEYNPDILVVLDKPIISQDFIDKINVPIIWIDHHPLVMREGVRYYNPKAKDPSIYLPTSCMTYKITGGKIWIAFIGTVGDYSIPYFIEEFRKGYPDLIGEEKEIGRIAYETQVMKLIRIYNFILKGKTSDVNKCISILTKIETPYEIMGKETARAKYIYKKYEKIEREYEELLAKAEKWANKDDFLIFTYPSKKISLTQELCNELSYKHPDKVIIVGREKDGEIRMGLRSKKKRIDEPLKKALVGIRGYGGGHEFACGGNVKEEDFPKFIEQLRKAIQEQPLHQR